MSDISNEAREFVAQLDAAAASHLDWTRRVLRCAVLRTSPGDDVLAADAHRRCRFGKWLCRCQGALAGYDADGAARLATTHERMHDAVRALCADLLSGVPGDPARLDDFERTQAGLIEILAHLKTEVLARAARRDPLTGLQLRHGLEEEFSRSRALARRHGRCLALVLADVDHFKHVNDTYGHAVGDQALQHVARTLMAQRREGEPVVRYGGEEFLMLLFVDDEQAAAQGAERILQALRDRPVELRDGALLPIRMSAGVVVVAPEESMAQALDRADRGLYAAKGQGRDCWRWGTAALAAPA